MHPPIWSTKTYVVTAQAQEMTIGRKTYPSRFPDAIARWESRAAVPVIRRVADTLPIEGQEKAGKQPGVIVAFSDIFRPVSQPAISDEEVESTARQIHRVHARDSTDRQSARHGIERTLPSSAPDGDSGIEQPVDCRESKTFGLPVIPAQAGKNSKLFRNRLLHV